MCFRREPYYLLFNWWFFVHDVQSVKIKPNCVSFEFQIFKTLSVPEVKSSWGSSVTLQVWRTCQVIVPRRDTLLLSPFLALSLLLEKRWACAAFLELIWITAADIQFVSSTGWRFGAGLQIWCTCTLSSSVFLILWSGSIMKKQRKFSLLNEHFVLVHLWPTE